MLAFQRRARKSFLLSLLLLLACFSRQALSVPLPAVDSLAEATKREFVAASLLSAKEDYRGAVDRFRPLLASEASNAALHYALSKAYASLGVLDSARIHSEKSVELDSGNKYYLDFLAVLSHHMNDYGRAAALYRQLATLEPGDTQPLISLALEHLAAGQPEKALEVFQEILKLDPKDETARAQVVLMEIKLLHYNDAIGTLTEFIRQGEGEEKLRFTLGELYTQTKEYDLALTTFRKLLQENPALVSGWLALFDVSVLSKNRTAFLQDLDWFHHTSQVSRKQKRELAKLFVIRSFRDTLFVDPALLMLDEIKKREPRNSELYLLSGKVRLQRDEGVQEAVEDFKKALALKPGDISNWENLVVASLMQKEFRVAREIVRKAKQRFPIMTLRLQVLDGEVFSRSGEIKKAVAVLEKAIQSKKIRRDKELYLQAGSTLGFCYEKLGLEEKSIHLYERILHFDPGNIVMMNNLAYIFALRGEELSRALDLATKVVAAEPSNAGYLDTLGWVLFRMGEYESALASLEKAVALDSREVEILDHLTEVYEKLGMQQKAEETRKKAKLLTAPNEYRLNSKRRVFPAVCCLSCSTERVCPIISVHRMCGQQGIHNVPSVHLPLSG